MRIIKSLLKFFLLIATVIFPFTSSGNTTNHKDVQIKWFNVKLDKKLMKELKIIKRHPHSCDQQCEANCCSDGFDGDCSG